MRTPLLLATAALFAVGTAAPAAAQISIDFGTYANRSRPVNGRQPVREVIVSPYSASRHGDYRRASAAWRPVTLYQLGNRYYQQQYSNARPVRVLTYRDDYFHEPRDRGWNDYRYRYERDGWGNNRRDDRRDDRWDDRWDDRRYDSHDRWHDKQDDKYEREHAKEHRKQAQKAEKAAKKRNKNGRGW